MRLGTAALILALSLGVVGAASAQESGNWFTRWFTPTPERPAEKKAEVKIDTTTISAAIKNNQAVKAEADWLRRQAVCNKLLELANALGDDDLRRKAELLDQRRHDLYLATKNQRPGIEPDVKKEAR